MHNPSENGECTNTPLNKSTIIRFFNNDVTIQGVMCCLKYQWGTKLDLINNYNIIWGQMVIEIKLNDGPEILAESPKPQTLMFLIKNPKTLCIQQPIGEVL
jgi:hypothetical protein